MAKRKHAEMIKAWADNDELIVLVRLTGGWLACSGLAWHEDSEYFICIPQRAEACLHWLNGGDVQQSPIECSQWVTTGNKREWVGYHSFMQEKLRFRIKPETEKRIIAIRNNECAPRNFTTIEQAKFWTDHNASANSDYWQFIEIEIEVEVE